MFLWDLALPWRRWYSSAVWLCWCLDWSESILEESISAWTILPSMWSGKRQKSRKQKKIKVTVHSYILVGRFHACMKICLHEWTKGAPFHEQKWAAQQRRALKARFCEWRGVNSNKLRVNKSRSIQAGKRSQIWKIGIKKCVKEGINQTKKKEEEIEGQRDKKTRIK